MIISLLLILWFAGAVKFLYKVVKKPRSGLAGCLVGIFEQYHKEDRYNQGIAGKNVPGGTPVGLGSIVNEMVDNGLGGQCSDGGTQSVGHQHEEALGTGADGLVGLLVDVERSGNVEEVKGYTIHDAGEDEHPYA